jgi:hypothetical protein
MMTTMSEMLKSAQQNENEKPSQISSKTLGWVSMRG